ncbi:MAG: T9SS type A sorting domain-containing protein, partial [Bacteroidales bacterium]|nr:T9SS type A sorting domain-containing protein [Bacteroidales bacterium]
TWEFVPYFEVTSSTQSYDAFEGTKLTPDTYFDGELALDIPFSFPFNNTSTQKIKVHTNGYVFPFSETFNWNQFREYLYPFFINENVIAPLARFSLVSDPAQSDGIWYKFSQDTVKIRWKECEKYAESWTSVHFGCNLISDGSIEFTYGQNYLSKRYTNLGGISYGNKTNNTLTFLDNVPVSNTVTKVKSYPKPQGLFITSDGIIYGEIGIYNHYPVKILMTDANGIKCSKVYDLSTGIKNQNIVLSRPIELFPNPAKDKIIIQVNDLSYEIANIRIYDNLGRLVETYDNIVLNNYILNVNDYKFGRYYVHFISGANNYTSSFIKK